MKRILIVFLLGVSCLWCEAQSNTLSEREWKPLMRKAMEWVTTHFDNGDNYKGQLSDNQRSGLGIYYWSDGSWYWGRWSGGRNGMGIYAENEEYEVANCPGCVYYVGNWSSGSMSGTGTCYDKYGKLIYHGGFSDDRPTDVYPSTGYTGYEFKCIEYTDGAMYLGETNNGMRHGYGIYLWSDGKMWYGPWKNGERGGYGIFLPYKGNSKVGRWDGDTYEEVEKACEQCNGNGYQICMVCGGAGGTEYVMNYPVHQHYWMPCVACNSTGRTHCYYCNGRGWVSNGSSADESFTKVRTHYASSGSSSSGGSYSGSGSSSDYASTESDEEVWDRAVAYDKAGNYTKAVPLYRQFADKGDATAQYNLGVYYANGRGVTKDDKQAVYWYRKAADQGVVTAQFNLGNSYYNGEGVTQDYKQAVYWYRKAADQGYASAQLNLGYCYANGRGVTKDDKQAVYWYRKAADQGDATAQFNLGNRYENGEGVTQDYKQAVYWYRKAADQGYANAQFNLGICYANGRGVTKDDKQAVYWYRKAADQGHATAQFNLGYCYETGEGVTKNGNKALYWYKKGLKSGNADEMRQTLVMISIGLLEGEGYSADRAGME